MAPILVEAQWQLQFLTVECLFLASGVKLRGLKTGNALKASRF